MKSPYKFVFFTVLLILIDQAIKLWMHFDVLVNRGGEIDIIPDFFKLHYVTNRGMAFGMELSGNYGKLLLSVFRLFAMVGIGYYLFHLAKRNAHSGLLWAIAAVWGGAIGNVIDSTFYGVWLHNSPIEAPYPLFHGQVIDMFYCYGLDGFWPNWVPYFGGTYNSTPIFNFADAAIFCGVLAILVFQKSFFHDERKHSQHIAESSLQSLDNEVVSENLTEENKSTTDAEDSAKSDAEEK